ncbi:Hypothetical predicted protein [Octopus vulgaris]|uniref:Uncharacterized protein n=1 Tax=Octopus vulgaris TaxID=6645 RepID=A0AA36B8B0_OCTVU|nr:Hypothetical predicted protein [Octopus vulgaris]
MLHNFWLGRRSGNVLFILLMLTLTCNIIFYSQRYLNKSAAWENNCDLNTYLKVSMKFIESKGSKSFKEILHSYCPGVDENDKDVQRLIWALFDLVNFCKKNVSITARPETNRPILTMFTSWDVNETKYIVHNNTVSNWIKLKKYVNPIIFTNSSRYKKLCSDAGWTVYPITHYAAGGAPVLKTMFLKAMENFNTTFYAFANGDILFEDGLIDTLFLLMEEMSIDNMSHPLLLIGRRTNVKYLSRKDASTHKSLRGVAREKGHLFLVNAEDYFITNRNYPWKDIPNLVIGRPAYDNWLVAHARRSNFTVIDASDTILAVHQTTNAGNWEGHKRKFSNYNDILLKKLKLPRRYRNGETGCTPLRTAYDLCSRIVVQERKVFPPQCHIKPG